jgi:hypothetical protein
MMWDGQRTNYYGVRYGTDDELCWNCELGFTLNSAPAGAVMHFCSPDCEKEWMADQALANLVEKHSSRKKRNKE